ncbi:serine hydrolase domain-containing protein [Flavobacterium ginsenosidimutans]|uniref:serine hydrolase domain-containing protein n=1 Tax=Flavobacterium ginsenosidimutans TaxID=687844 RepID=UPI000DAD8F6A|nr:serine hydrolase domain-containing protein [Flavobacterium ginsenosidimutans]KAF2326596.1 beta-lactamase family protein [Flavobacterium ginsenosidimutans]
MKTIIIYFMVALASLIMNCYGQSKTDNFKNYFDLISSQHNGNILVSQNGKTIAQLSSGYSNIPKKQTCNINSSFNLASISKVITSTAVLQLRDKGKFKLDDPLTNYLKEFPFKDVTIRHLLTHTSGLPDLELFEELVKHFPDTIITNRNIIPELQKWKHGLYFKPGDEFRYCNTEYNLLALLIEKTSGLKFNTYLEKNIFRKAGMHHTYLSIYPDFDSKDKLAVIPHGKEHPGYDSTYTAADSIPRYKYLNYNNKGTVGQGGVMSTTTDLLLFDRAFFNGKLLKMTSLQEALTPLTLNNGSTYYQDRMDTLDGEGKMTYGLGWEIFEQPDYGKSVGHGGYKIGLATFYWHNIAKDQVLIGFDNTASSEFGRFLTSSIAILNDKSPLAIRTSKSLVTLYGTALVNRGIDYAASVLNSNNSKETYYLSEWEMNELGYNLYYMSKFKGHEELALETFKLATLLFQDSFNTYDSYAQLLMESGKNEEAVMMYSKSIIMNPDNEQGKQKLAQLLNEK